MIYVGTCGFSYKDWVGPVYPAGTKPGEMLGLYARSFRAVEIDSSYYGVPTAKTIASMVARTPANFKFSFKAPQTVTHASETARGQVHPDAREFAESLRPAVTAGKLACILLQFPNGFKPDGSAIPYVRRVVDAFVDGFPVVVEFRNKLWQNARTLELLGELGAGYCNVDMPNLEDLLHPSSDVTSSIGYVRFHGRNAKMWWQGSNVTRYDYTYAEEELAPWADRVAEIEAQAKETYVYFNNHANGKAAKNAEMFEELLEERYGEDATEIVAQPPAPPPKQGAFDFG